MSTQVMMAPAARPVTDLPLEVWFADTRSVTYTVSGLFGRVKYTPASRAMHCRTHDGELIEGGPLIAGVASVTAAFAFGGKEALRKVLCLWHDDIPELHARQELEILKEEG